MEAFLRLRILRKRRESIAQNFTQDIGSGGKPKKKKTETGYGKIANTAEFIKSLSPEHLAGYTRMDESQREFFKYLSGVPDADVSKIDLVGKKEKSPEDSGGTQASAGRNGRQSGTRQGWGNSPFWNKNAGWEAQTDGFTHHSGSFTSPASDGGTTERAVDNAQSRRESKAPLLPAQETVWQRALRTITGGAKNSLAGFTDVSRALYEAGQGGRTREMEELRDQAARETAQAEQQLAYLLEHPEAGDAETARNFADYWKRQLDACNMVLDGNVQQRAAQQTAALADELQHSSKEELDRAKAGLGWFGRELVDAGASQVQMAGDALLGAALGPGKGTVPLLLRTFGSGTMEARQRGGTTEQQLLYGGFQAGVELLTEKLFSAALPFKAAYGRGNPTLEQTLDDLVDLAVRKFSASPAGKRILGAGLQAGRSFLTEGLEEFVGDWLEWQLPRIYGGDVSSFSDQLVSSLHSFFSGGLGGLFGSVIDPGTYGYGVGTETDQGNYMPDEIGWENQSIDAAQVETVWQRYLREYDETPDEKEVALSNNHGSIIPSEVFIRSSAATSDSVQYDRPTWRQSEIDVGIEYPDYSPQVSFLNGVEVPYGTPGSVRPDFYKPGYSIEVKNYNISTDKGRSSLISNVLTHFEKRETNLPASTRQAVIIDLRGQKIPYDELARFYLQLQSVLTDRMDFLFFVD